jgi:hypothetical protein
MLRLTPLVLLFPSIALAQPAKTAGDELDPFFNSWSFLKQDPGSRASSLEAKTDPLPNDCDAAIAKARKAGLGDTARIYSRYAYQAKEYAEFDDKKEAYISLKNAAALCAKYRQYTLIAPAAKKQSDTAQKQDAFSRLVEPGEMSDDDSFIKDGKECLEITDKAIKAGAPADLKVKIFSDQLTLAEGRTKVCQGMIDWATQLRVKIKDAKKADREKRAAPYKALGVDGKKLELFLEYDDVYWRGGANCQRIDDLKVLAKAKVLFHWLENADGTHTIRKYTFDGNKVSGPVSKTFKTAGAAQAGCR